MKKKTLFVFLLTLCLLLAACSAQQPSGSTQPPKEAQSSANVSPSEQPSLEDKPYIAMFPKAYVGDFWKTVELGAMDAAKELDVELTFEGCDTETNIDQQIKLVENAISKKADVIAIAPLDSEGLVPILETASESGIKIVSFNSGLGGNVSLVHVATDNWAAGGVGGEALGKLMSGEGKYAIIGAVETVKTNRDRSDGCAAAIA